MSLALVARRYALLCRPHLDTAWGNVVKVIANLKRALNPPGQTVCCRVEQRTSLLGVNGISSEIAESILLYSGGKPFYGGCLYQKGPGRTRLDFETTPTATKSRDCSRKNLPKDTRLENKFHALIVKVGKEQ